MPCGVDVSSFDLATDYEAAHRKLSVFLDRVACDECLDTALFDQLEVAARSCDAVNLESLIQATQQNYDYSLPERPFVDTGLDFNSSLREGHGCNIYFLGKLIPAKGLQDLIVAFAELLADGTAATLTVTAFGKYREHFDLMLRALSSGDRDLLDRVLSLDPHFADAQKYYRCRDDSYFDGVRVADPHSHVFFTGRLGHDELRSILPLMDVIVTPSRIPEAFGMVAIEGMACGVLSAMAYFSGLVDIADMVARYFDTDTVDLIRLDHEDLLGDLRRKLPRLIARASRLTPEDRLTLRNVVVENFTWDAIARQFVETVRGGVTPGSCRGFSGLSNIPPNLV